MSESGENPLEELATLLESCEPLHIEPNLQPVHMVAGLAMEGELTVALRDVLRRWGYKGRGELVLESVEDWPAECNRLPLFDAGFASGVVDDEKQGAHRRAIATALDTAMGAGARVWALRALDSTGTRLMPAGGTSRYFVFDSPQRRLLLDIGWDS